MPSTRPHPFSLRQLQYAVAVLEHGGFGSAARACAVAQPSLSAQVGALEEAIGLQLFERGSRAVEPTSAGAVWLQSARRLLEAADALQAEARHRDPLSGELTLGAIPTLGPYLIPALRARKRVVLPDLTVRWQEHKTSVLVAKVLSGELDGGLLAEARPEGGLDGCFVADDPFLLAASSTHPLGASNGPVEVEALRGQEVLLLDDGHCLKDQALEVCGRVGAQGGEVGATSLGTLLQLVGAGEGLTFLPALAVPAEGSRPGLVLRRFVQPSPHRPVRLIWRRGSPVGPAMEAIGELLAEVIAAT